MYAALGRRPRHPLVCGKVTASASACPSRCPGPLLPASPLLMECSFCEDLSKGGLSFRSRNQYPEGSCLEVAVPYTPGTGAIFVPSASFSPKTFRLPTFTATALPTSSLRSPPDLGPSSNSSTLSVRNSVADWTYFRPRGPICARPYLFMMDHVTGRPWNFTPTP
jgi:hypothetical protein